MELVRDGDDDGDEGVGRELRHEELVDWTRRQLPLLQLQPEDWAGGQRPALW